MRVWGRRLRNIWYHFFDLLHCKVSFLIKEDCHCEKIQASLRASIFEAILPSVTAEVLIHANFDNNT